jgi:hypothetical protein
VTDEEVPGHVLVLRGLGVEGWNSVVDVRTLVVTGLDQEGLVAGERKAGSERLDLMSVSTLYGIGLVTYATTSTTSDDNILVALELNTASKSGKGYSRAKKLAEEHFVVKKSVGSW